VLYPRLAAVFALALLDPALALASYAPQPLKTTVATSDLIVVGTLGSIRASPGRAGVSEHEGVISVEAHLAGDAVKGGRCTLAWATGIPNAIDYRARAGQKGIWLLHRAGRGRYEASYPARYQPLEARAKIEALIRTPLYLVDMTGGDGKACCIRLVIRTFLPRLEVRDHVTAGQTLGLHGGARVEVQGQIGDRIAPLPGRISHGRSKHPIVVTRERAHTVEVDLRKYFALQGRKGQPGREVFHVHWGTGPDDRSPSYTFEL